MIVRGLTLARPWPATIVAGPKRVENRGWKPTETFPVGSLLALHAGLKWDRDAIAFIRRLWPQLDVDPAHHPFGAIVGVAEFLGATRPVFSHGGPWAFGAWCWDLGRVIALEKGIPATGAYSLWPLEAAAEREVLAAWSAP